MNILLLGTDKNLYTKKSVTDNDNQKIDGSYNKIMQHKDGTFFMLGTDNQIYTKTTVTSPPVLAPNSGAFLKLEQLEDGTFLGIGTDTQLYTKATINSAPVKAGTGGFIEFVQNKALKDKCPNCPNCPDCPDCPLLNRLSTFLLIIIFVLLAYILKDFIYQLSTDIINSKEKKFL